MNEIEFYTNLIESAGLTVGKDSVVYIPISGGGAKPLTISGKQLIIPTHEVLKESDWDKYIAFHPLAESATRKESVVFKRLRAIFNRKMTMAIVGLMDNLMRIASTPELHEKLKPAQLDLLTALDNVDTKTYTNLTKVIEVIKPTGDTKVVNIYPKKSGKWKGKDYRRVAVVSFPILQHIDTDEGTIFGVKVRKKDLGPIQNLFEYILPNSTDPESYSLGTNTMIAPMFYSIVMAYSNIMATLQGHLELFGDMIDDKDDIQADLSYVDYMDKLNKYRAAIPVLDGNEGELVEGESEEEEAPATKPGLSPKAKRSYDDVLDDREPAVNTQAPRETQRETTREPEPRRREREPEVQDERPSWRAAAPRREPARGYEPRYERDRYDAREPARYAEPRHAHPRDMPSRYDERRHDVRRQEDMRYRDDYRGGYNDQPPWDDRGGYGRPAMSPREQVEMDRHQRRYAEPRYARPRY